MWWLARGEEHVPVESTWLSDAESDYADRQRFTKRRTEFLIARWTAKNALAQFLSLTPTPEQFRSIEIRHAPTGAPQAYVDGRPAGVEVSLTDRAGWAVCLISTGPLSVGCDLELVEPRSAAFVEDYLTESERVFVRSSGATHDLFANLIWSAKESGLKVLGTGLRRDTRSVTVSLSTDSDGWNPLAVRTTEDQLFPGWWGRFGQFVLTMAAQYEPPMPVCLDDPPLLGRAVPAHSWLPQPTRLTPDGPSPAPERR